MRIIPEQSRPVQAMPGNARWLLIFARMHARQERIRPFQAGGRDGRGEGREEKRGRHAPRHGRLTVWRILVPLDGVMRKMDTIALSGASVMLSTPEEPRALARGAVID